MILLRPLRLEDAPLMYEWMTDPSINRFFRFDASNVTVASCSAFIEQSGLEPNTIHFAIADESNEYLGTISLKDIDAEKKCAEYAISTRKKVHGTGVAKEATERILQLAFGELGLNRVYLNVLEENERANAFYRKAGFRLIQREENALCIQGIWKTLNWYEIKGQ